MQNKKWQTNFDKNFIAPKYEEMVHGLNLRPEQDKELRKLYSCAHIPVTPWGFIFTGVLTADLLAGLYAISKVFETGDIHDMKWYFTFVGAQFVALLALAARMKNAEKKLHNRIDEIKSDYLRQISR